MGRAVEKERNEEWERESDVRELGSCPIGEETDVPIRALDMCVN